MKAVEACEFRAVAAERVSAKLNGQQTPICLC